MDPLKKNAGQREDDAPWTPRRRIHATIERREADRVPLAFWGSYYGPHDPLYRGLLDVLGLPFQPSRQFRKNLGHTVNYYDDRVLEAMGVDTRYVWLGSTDVNSPDFSKVERGTEAEGEDLYGVGFCMTGYQVQVVPGRFPIDGGEIETFDLSKIENYQFPPVQQLVRIEELEKRAMSLADETDYAVVARAPNSFGLFEQSCHLIGHEPLYMCIALNKPVVHLLAQRLKEFFMELYDVYLTAVGPYIDVIELPGDDYSGTGMSMVAPETFDEFYLEPWRELIGLIRSKAPRAKILFHSDGYIMEFVPCFISTGADVINSIETDVGNDIAEMKRDHGQKTAFWGALDVKRPMQAGREAIERDIDEKMGILKPSGGWIFSAENHVQRDVDPENLLYAYEYAAKVGRY